MISHFLFKNGGGGTITVKATIYSTFKDIDKRAAKAAMNSNHDLAAQTYKSGSYTDKEGNKWASKFDISYAYRIRLAQII